MSRDSIVLKILTATIGAAIIFMIVHEVVQDHSLTSEVGKLGVLLVVVEKKYSTSNGTLLVSLQNLGEPLDLVTREDFKWFLNEYAMGPVNRICFPNGRIAKWERGEIIQVELKTGKDFSRGRIILIFRESFLIEFSVCFSFYSKVI